MNTVIANLMLAFACCVLLSALYWEVVHFVLVKGVRFQLFAMRDSARRIACERGLGTSPSYIELEKFICKTIGFVPHIGLISFLCFVAKTSKKVDAEKSWGDFEKEAPPEFMVLRDSTAKAALIIMMLNSPWVMFVGSLLFPIAWARGKISKARLYSSTERFVEELKPEPVAC